MAFAPDGCYDYAGKTKWRALDETSIANSHAGHTRRTRSAGVAVAGRSYASLVKQGYKTGKLSKNAAGAQGWTVVKRREEIFLQNEGHHGDYVGGSGLVSILSNGRQIKLDRKTFEAGIGGPDPNIPQLSALKAGKLNARDVGGCAALK